MALKLSGEAKRQFIVSSYQTINTVKKLAKMSDGEKLLCPYSGKILTPKETNNLAEHIIPAKTKVGTVGLTQKEIDDLNVYLKSLDNLIAKHPDDIGLRKYRSIIQEHTGL